MGLSKTTKYYIEYSKKKESTANVQTDKILSSIQTLEGLDIYSNECGYATEINPYKVIDCYYKNQDRIEKAGK
jgi:hypothetical protein